MKYSMFGFCLCLFWSLGCKESTNKAPEEIAKYSFEIETYVSKSSIRAIHAVSDTEMWFAGSKGIYGYTSDGGLNWQVDSLLNEDVENMEFRAIHVQDSTVFLMNVGSPALMYRSQNRGENWEIVYRENEEGAFYDAMAFWNEKEGIVFGDPVDSCISILVTRNGGNSWTKLDCNTIPDFKSGEAGFAASNTNISIHGDNAWIGTGGSKARIFYSPDKGNTWTVYETPIQQGGQMTGIFSTSFWDENIGIIWGGDWENQANNKNNKAITADGGKTWTLVSDGNYPGYRSCVQYHPNKEAKELIAVGIPGISYSYDAGQNWESVDSMAFYTARFSPSGNMIWLAGGEKLGKMTFK